MKTQNITPKVILGSSSIYRKELLQRLQIPFETTNPQINETPLPNELPEETAARLAEAKARAVAKIHPQALIIGSDQVAALGDIRLGKPLNHTNAYTVALHGHSNHYRFDGHPLLLTGLTQKCPFSL